MLRRKSKFASVPGSNYFSRWAIRFERKALAELKPYYLLDRYEAELADLGTSFELEDILHIDVKRDRLASQINFLRAYLNTRALDLKSIYELAKELTRCHSEKYAQDGYGVWFSQSRLEKFGAGTSLHFQGDRGVIFCHRLSSIDFSDVSAILPHDRIAIRNLRGIRWTPQRTAKVVGAICDDFAFDGYKVRLKHRFNRQWLDVEILNPDLGIF